MALTSIETILQRHFKATPYIPKRIRTAGKLRHPGDAIMGYAYEFLYGITKGTPKITLPAPSRLHHQYPDSAVDANVYPDIDEFWSDLASLYQREIAALEALGCNYIQLDDPIISLFVDDTRRAHSGEADQSFQFKPITEHARVAGCRYCAK